MTDIQIGLWWVGGLFVFAGAVVVLFVAAAGALNADQEVYERQRELSAAAMGKASGLRRVK